MSARAGQAEAREAVLRAALTVLGAERMLHVDSTSMTALKAAEDTLAIACRDLTNAVDDLPPLQRPGNWARDEEGRTA